jgi:hypothetical protein
VVDKKTHFRESFAIVHSFGPFSQPCFLGRDGNKAENFLDMLWTVSTRQRMAEA